MTNFQRTAGSLFLIVVFFISFPCVSSGAELSVEIKTTPEGAVLPLEVEFEAIVTGGIPPYSYTWNFGDGGTSVLLKDSHYYREAGQYKIILTVGDSADNYDTASKSVIVSSSVFDPANTFFTTYSNTEIIQAIVQDRDDNIVLWIGTTGGLVRLNTVTGEKKIYVGELPDNDVQALLQTLDGDVWAGTEGGLARFDYVRNEWTVYDVFGSEIPDNDVQALLQTSDSAIWAGTEGGLARFDYVRNEWTVYDASGSKLPDNDVLSLLQTPDGVLWAGTWDGLARFDHVRNEWTVYNASSSGLPDNYVLSLLQTSDGAVWTGTWGGGLARLDYVRNEWTVYNASGSGLPDNDIQALLQTPDGAVWAGTWGGGLARFDYVRNEWTVYDATGSGLPDDDVQALLQTSDGTVWTGTLSGLSRFDYMCNEWTVYDTSGSGLSDNYFQTLLQTPDSAVWTGTWGGGLSRFDYMRNEWTVYNAFGSGLPDNSVYSLLQTTDGAVWAGTRGGLARFDYMRNEWTVYDATGSGLPDNYVQVLLQATDGAVWAGTSYCGLVRFDYVRDEWTVYDASGSGLPDNFVQALLQTTDGAVWAGTGGDGLARFDYMSNKWTVYDDLDSGLPDNYVQALLQTPDSAVWTGTGGGLARFDYVRNEWTVYDASCSELPDNDVQSLLQTPDGAVWVGTDGGLARFDYVRNKWTVYDASCSGLPNNEVYSLLQTLNGAVWAGTWGGGLCRISFPRSSQSPGRLILIAGGSASKTNPLWHTTKELAASAYRIFNLRGFRNTDIHLMSPEKWFDFNGDGFDDHVVDCPPSDQDRNLTVEDIRYAITDWAVKTHTPDTPLVLYLIDHGYPDDGIHGPHFMIAPGELLYAKDLSEMLNIYETATNGQVILINESCYSGQFLNHLKKPGRIIITATADKVVNYDNWGANSFTSHFLQKIFENNSLFQAFAKTKSRLRNSPFTSEQTPQLDDNGDGKYDTNDGIIASALKIGGDYSMGTPWPDITDITKTDPAGTSASFTLKTNAHMRKVWGTVRAPNYILDMSGDFQQINLEKFDLWDNNDDLEYKGRYDRFTQAGKYIVTFYAKDQFGNAALSDPMEIYIGITPGDLNSDGEVNLGDAILALKISAGMKETSDLNADIGNNGEIGLEDAVFALQKAAGIR